VASQRPVKAGWGDLVAGVWGRHELYVHSLVALLASGGAHVRVLEQAPGRTAVRELQLLFAESPLSSELESLSSLGPPVIVIQDRAEPEDVLAAMALGASGVLRKNATLAELSLAIAAVVRGEADLAPVDLTPRQRQVLGLIAEGLDNAEIARRLGISTRTARAHVSSVLERLGVQNRTQAAVLALKRGMISFLIALVLAATTLAGAAPPSAAASAAQHLGARLGAQMRGAGPYSGAWVADANSGKQLFAFRADVTRTPASVQKLFTTSTALERMGASFRIETAVYADGVLSEDGTLAGSLYLKGFGDPSFGKWGLARLADQVRRAGVRAVTGRVYGDESFFDAHRGLPAGGFRTSVDVGPLSALSFNQGTLRGFGRGFQRDPPGFVAERFRAALASRGVEVERGGRPGETPETSPSIASVHSPTLAALVRHTNQVSDNYFAETLLKGLGARFARGGTTLAGAAVVKSFENQLGLNSSVLDGSGLSRGDGVSPRTVGRLLLAVDDKPWFGSLYRSLPLAGRSGTLRKRMRGTSASGRCRAKTGTLIGVSALAGYCRSRARHRIAFAVLMNGTAVWKARALQDRIAAAIAAYRR
jgi:D-alanyl-D-alanine carboxypeptidase/D-alanyl-D-alanine-endopeptidase (penicillin-binding protein 4)